MKTNRNENSFPSLAAGYVHIIDNLYENFIPKSRAKFIIMPHPGCPKPTRG